MLDKRLCDSIDVLRSCVGSIGFIDTFEAVNAPLGSHGLGLCGGNNFSPPIERNSRLRTSLLNVGVHRINKITMRGIYSGMKGAENLYTKM